MLWCYNILGNESIDWNIFSNSGGIGRFCSFHAPTPNHVLVGYGSCDGRFFSAQESPGKWPATEMKEGLFKMRYIIYSGHEVNPTADVDGARLGTRRGRRSILFFPCWLLGCGWQMNYIRFLKHLSLLGHNSKWWTEIFKLFYIGKKNSFGRFVKWKYIKVLLQN